MLVTVWKCVAMSFESARKTRWPPLRISARSILIAFVALLFIVFLSTLTSTYKMAVVGNTCTKMTSDMLRALYADTVDTARVSALKWFQTKNDMERDNITRKENLNETHHIVSVSNFSQTSSHLDKEFNSTVVLFDVLGNALNSSKKTRQTTCFGCFKHDFKYLIENDDICQETSNTENVSLIIIILTTHSNVNSRNALRRTWLTYTKNNTGNVRYAFLLGESNCTAHKQSVIDENTLFRDIIKEDFVDSYQNVTYKTIMGLKWVSQKCSNAKYVLKTDDDMWINIPTLLARLDNAWVAKRLQTSVAGKCFKRAFPNRNKQSKWYSSYINYPEKTYPGFCSGTGYVTSVKVAHQIYEISSNVPFFHLEDVYVALCIRKLGLKLETMPGFNARRPDMDPCLYKGYQLISAHWMTPTMIHSMWNRACIKTPRVGRVKRIS